MVGEIKEKPIEKPEEKLPDITNRIRVKEDELRQREEQVRKKETELRELMNATELGGKSIAGLPQETPEQRITAESDQVVEKVFNTLGRKYKK